MSEATTRAPWTVAALMAEELAGMLSPACHRIEVAGSIRRVKIDVGDIDLVCEPKVRPIVDMFDEPTGEDIDELHELLCTLERDGTVNKRLNKNGQPSWGHSLKRAVFRGMPVDVQAVTDRDSWGFWLLIRTGPAALNKALVTPRHQGGLLSPGFEVKDSFKLYRGGGRIPTPTEADVFDALGLPYIDPPDREHFPHVGVAGGAS